MEFPKMISIEVWTDELPLVEKTLRKELIRLEDIGVITDFGMDAEEAD